MKKLLTDIELDFYELKCLLEYLDKNPSDQNIYKVTKRSLTNLTSRMSELETGFEACYKDGFLTPTQEELRAAPIVESVIANPVQEPVVATEDVEELIVVPEVVVEPVVEPAPQKVEPIQDQAFTFEPGAMFRALSLNDVFRFSRELFGGDTTKLKEAVGEMEKLGGYEQAIGYLSGRVVCNLDDQAFLDMDDFLKRYFKY